MHNICRIAAKNYYSFYFVFYVFQINAEFQRITTIPLETTFMARLDSCTPLLTSVFAKKGGVTGQNLAKHLEI